jgi:hypothetical protein
MTMNRGGFVKLREVAGGRPLARWQHTGEVLSVAFSSDGARLASGSNECSLPPGLCSFR